MQKSLKRKTKTHTVLLIIGALILASCSSGSEAVQIRNSQIPASSVQKTSLTTRSGFSEAEKTEQNSSEGETVDNAATRERSVERRIFSQTKDPSQTTVEVTVASENPIGELQVSTTANVQIKEVVDQRGKQIVDEWLLNPSDADYKDLADRLESSGLITKELADDWRTQGAVPVKGLAPDAEIIRMWPVRVASDSVTFQISLQDSDTTETLTFLEFVLEDGLWKATEVV